MEVQLKENKDTFAKLEDELQKKYQNAQFNYRTFQMFVQAKVISNLQDQINLLQMNNESLTAKNNELEKVVKQLKEKKPLPVNENIPS